MRLHSGVMHMIRKACGDEKLLQCAQEVLRLSRRSGANPSCIHPVSRHPKSVTGTPRQLQCCWPVTMSVAVSCVLMSGSRISPLSIHAALHVMIETL